MSIERPTAKEHTPELSTTTNIAVFSGERTRPRVPIAGPRRNVLDREKFAMARAPSPAREARALPGFAAFKASFIVKMRSAGRLLPANAADHPT